MKRDDDIADAFGGGKVRKLELFFGEAKALAKTALVTFGGVGSNQAIATALLGRAQGFSVTLCLAPQPKSSLVTTNLRADAASGADLRLFSSVSLAEATLLAEARANPKGATYAIEAGGTAPVGTLAFVSAGLEVCAAIRRGELPAPARIYVALGLGGTAAGIAMGCALGGLDTEVVAVRASNPSTVSSSTLTKIVEATTAFARTLDPSFPTLSPRAIRLRIDGRFVGRGYGSLSREGNKAVERAQHMEGWALDPVYTGKALAALIRDARSGPTVPWLFWNTQSSRPLPSGPVPTAFQPFLDETPLAE